MAGVRRSYQSHDLTPFLYKTGENRYEGGLTIDFSQQARDVEGTMKP
jgi:hypothetical protein